MKLGFDIDGITANMALAMVTLMNEKYNLNYDVTVFKNFNIHENTYVDDPVLNEEIAMAMRSQVIENPGAVGGIEIYPDAVEALRKLSKAGHTIHHITARPQNQHDATVAWLRKHYVPFDTVHVIGKNGKDGHRVSKGQIGRSLNLDFFIDDSPRHLTDMYRYKNRWRKGLALYTRPWNINDPVNESLINRFSNWKKIIRHIGIQKR